MNPSYLGKVWLSVSVRYKIRTMALWVSAPYPYLVSFFSIVEVYYYTIQRRKCTIPLPISGGDIGTFPKMEPLPAVGKIPRSGGCTVPLKAMVDEEKWRTTEDPS